VRDLQVHFSHRQQPDHPLSPGVHRIVRHATGTVRIVDDTQGALLLAQFCLDRRGLWLQVANGVRGLHVNGRPVRRMALLRAGDAVYADGVEMVVRARLANGGPIPPSAPAESDGEVAMVLRGVGGQHHGRSFTLATPRVVGSAAEADIVIDDPAFAARHASFELHDGRLLLRDLGSDEGSIVNGVPVRDCWLQPCDQIAFDGRHRFVVEVPLLPAEMALTAPAAVDPEPVAASGAAAAPAAGAVKVARWPWLLLSAALLGAAISALLWFGAR
jgi:hypothetical protein